MGKAVGLRIVLGVHGLQFIARRLRVQFGAKDNGLNGLGFWALASAI